MDISGMIEAVRKGTDPRKVVSEGIKLPKPEVVVTFKGDGVGFKYYYPFGEEQDVEEQKKSSLKEFMTVVDVFFKKYGGKKKYGFPQSISNLETSTLGQSYPYFRIKNQAQEPVILTKDFNQKNVQERNKIDQELKSLIGRFGWVVDSQWDGYTI